MQKDGCDVGEFHPPLKRRESFAIYLEELQEMEKKIYESFLHKFRDEEDPETLAYFATDAYFEREFPLTKQRVYVSI